MLMKSPLNYQLTSSDNPNVALINAFLFVFEREEMPNEVLKCVMDASTRFYVQNSNFSNNYYASFMLEMVKAISDISKRKNLTFDCVYAQGEEVSLSSLLFALKNNGCFVVRVWKSGQAHYVVATGMDTEYVYLFDPYFEYASTYKNDENVKIVQDMPFKCNRKIKLEHFILSSQKDYCLGEKNVRNAVVILKKNEPKEREFE